MAEEETETDVEAEEVAEPKKGGGMFMLIIVLVVGLAGGAGAMFFLGDMLFGGDDSETAEVKEKEPEPPQPLVHAEFKRIAVPVFTETGAGRKFVGNYFLDISIGVETTDQKLHVEAKRAAITHGFIAAINNVGVTKEANSTEIDYQRLSSILTSVVDSNVSPGTAKEVSVTSTVRSTN